jgi:hypothetical protein
MSKPSNRSQPPIRVGGRPPAFERQPALLMCAVAATLAVMSFLHLSGILAGGTKPFDPSGAGVAEAVICLVLSYGATGLLRTWPRAQKVALAATGLAIVGFIIGLRFTLEGGDAIDVAYHLSGLPILLVTLIALLRIRTRGTHRDRRTVRANSGARS